MNKEEILRDKCEATLELMNRVNNEQQVVFKKYLDDRTEILLDKYITLGETLEMLMKLYKKYIDELAKLCK